MYRWILISLFHKNELLMLNNLFYLGCFDDGAFEKTWCFSVVVCQVITFCGGTFTCHMIYFLVGRICITLLVEWFILPLGEFVLVIWFISFCSLYDLYSRLGNLYNFACRMIYNPSKEFVSFFSSYDLYPRLANLYHFASHMIYTPAWGICIILLVDWFILPLGEFV